jgi:hypothetical protein
MWRTKTLQRLLDRTCVNLRSNRFICTGQTEWRKTPLGFDPTFRRAYPLHYQRYNKLSPSKRQVKPQRGLPSLNLTVAKPRFSQSGAINGSYTCNPEAFAFLISQMLFFKVPECYRLKKKKIGGSFHIEKYIVLIPYHWVVLHTNFVILLYDALVFSSKCIEFGKTVSDILIYTSQAVPMGALLVFSLRIRISSTGN